MEYLEIGSPDVNPIFKEKNGVKIIPLIIGMSTIALLIYLKRKKLKNDTKL